MNACPTSNPVTTSNSQYARDAASSRNSFSTSHRHSRERKKHLLEPTIGHTGTLAQFVDRAVADDAAVAEQHQTVADPRGVVQLVDRQEERTATVAVRAQHVHHLARLPQI